MERYLTLIAGLVAACLILLLPGAAGYVGLQAQRIILRTEAEINARQVTELIKDNPELWRFQTARLEHLLDPRSIYQTPENRAVTDLQGRTIGQAGNELDRPLLSETSPVHDAGCPEEPVRAYDLSDLGQPGCAEHSCVDATPRGTGIAPGTHGFRQAMLSPRETRATSD